MTGRKLRRPAAGTRPLDWILIAAQTIAMLATALVRICRLAPAYSGYAWVSLIFTLLILLLDVAWLIQIRPGRALEASSWQVSLKRPHSLIAWLIFHTAAIPLALLAEHASTLSVLSYGLFLLAILMMGLVPVALIIWMDHYLRKKSAG